MVNNYANPIINSTPDISQIESYKDLGIVIIDMQSHFLNSLEREISISLVNNILSVIKQAKILRLNIYNVFMNGVGEINSEILNELSEYDKFKKYCKDEDDVFQEGEFADIVKYDISLFFMGVYASSCIYKSSLGARNNDFIPLVSNSTMVDSLRVKKDEIKLGLSTSKNAENYYKRRGLFIK